MEFTTLSISVIKGLNDIKINIIRHNHLFQKKKEGYHWKSIALSFNFISPPLLRPDKQKLRKGYTYSKQNEAHVSFNYMKNKGADSHLKIRTIGILLLFNIVEHWTWSGACHSHILSHPLDLKLLFHFYLAKQ